MELLTMLARKGILLFSLTALSCLMASAQVSNGTIVGTITDTSGAVVSGARVVGNTFVAPREIELAAKLFF
jgi:hypothetical protein